MPLPLGEVSPKVTERARMPTEKREDGDNFALTRRLLIAVRRFFCPSLALSGAARQLSQGESLGEVSNIKFQKSA